MRYAIGIDLGGTKTAAGVVDEEGRVLLTAETPTLARDGAEVILDATGRLVHRLLRQAEAGGIQPDTVGIGSAGVIDPANGVVISATDAIRDWAGTHLTKGLEDRIGLPCSAINDVHAHALGESWSGAAAYARSALLVAVGTGVGGSFVFDGAPLLGAHNAAGHIGHFASPYAYHDGVGRPCTCGGSGHVEAVASGPAILETYAQNTSSRVPVYDTREVYARAAAGDPGALNALSTGAAAAGQAIGGLVNILDPEVVVVSGGMAAAGPLWWTAMERAVSGELMKAVSDVPIVRAKLGSAAALIGAARLALTLETVEVGS